MAELVLQPRQYLELEKLVIGAFRPLDGFMDEAQFRAVVETRSEERRVGKECRSRGSP